jgi:hypothetical protein
MGYLFVLCINELGVPIEFNFYFLFFGGGGGISHFDWPITIIKKKLWKLIKIEGFILK